MSTDPQDRSPVMRWREAICESDLSAMARLVAHTLSTNLNDLGQAFPSQETLARRSGVTRKTVITALKELETSGFLTYANRSKGRGSHLYQAVIPNRVGGTQFNDPTVTLTPSTVTLTPSNRVPRTHESIKESDMKAFRGTRVPDYLENCADCNARLPSKELHPTSLLCESCLTTDTSLIVTPPDVPELLKSFVGGGPNGYHPTTLGRLLDGEGQDP